MHPAQERHVATLADLGITEDPGTSWHPHPDKTEARNGDGNLRNLGDNEVLEHQAKPEAADQIDAGVLLEAEDSAESPEGEV